MKRNITAVKLLLLAGVSFVFLANRGGSPGGRSGSATDGGATCATQGGCHGPKTPILQEALSADFPSTGYSPGSKYKIAVRPTNTGTSVWGFECMAENSEGNTVGLFMNNDDSNIQGGGQRSSHKQASSSSTAGSTEWILDWTAPEAGTGNITFYVAVLAANGNGNTNGDNIIIDTLVVSEGKVSSISDLVENEIKIFPNPVITELRIESKFYINGGLLEIFDAKGNVVIHTGIVDKLSVSALAAGTYYAKISQGDKVITKTFIKQ
ncbi:MAG: hypothetical protein ACI9GO_000262 [Bacteroidia bacterium]|jgi:hypothetical protein